MSARAAALPSVVSAERRGQRVRVLFSNGCKVSLSLAEARQAASDPEAAAAVLRRFAGAYGGRGA